MLFFLLSSNLTLPSSAVVVTNQSARIAYPSAYDWPSFLHSANHNGTTQSTSPLTNKEIAHINLNGSISSSLALYNGILFISGGAAFRVVNSSTMVRNSSLNQGWNFTLPPGNFFNTSSPAVGGGNVYVGFTDHRLYAFEADT